MRQILSIFRVEMNSTEETVTEQKLEMRYHRSDLDKKELLHLYKGMLKPRMIEEKMLVLLRQGKISKWFSGIGQEAVSVGVASAMKPEEYVLPMHRNLGVFTSREIPLWKLFAQWQGKVTGFTKGRDRSFHFGTQSHKIIGMISHLGPQLGVANGIALSELLNKTGRLSVVFTGEGGTSEGDFHEALNVASVWNLPVVFLIENNGYALSTPTHEQYACKRLTDRAKGYGMESRELDGNNIVEVYTKLKSLFKDVRRRPRPVLVECKTFRMRGHEEASGTKYVPEKLLKKWEKKDPLSNFEDYLLKEGILSTKKCEKIKSSIAEEIDEHWAKALAQPEPLFDKQAELQDVFAPFSAEAVYSSQGSTSLRLIDAVSDGLKLAMRKFKNLVIMGQDVAEYGGVFKVTEGFVDEFGKERVRNTPICESTIVSAGMGLSIAGMKAVVEMQFGDFVSSGFNPIVNYLAKTHYRWGQSADVVVRMPCGAGVGAGPFHSQTNEAWFTKTPGLKVVYPAFPYDAKGLLIAAIEDPNPVLFFEHKKLYRSISEAVPDDYYNLPLGKARLVRKGDRMTVVTYGAGVHWVLDLLDRYPDLNLDLVDLRSLVPLDMDTVLQSVKKTGKVLLVQEDNLFGSIGSEIAAQIGEFCFAYLDGPVKRVGSLETPIPFARALEDGYLPQQRLEEELLALYKY